MIAVSSFGGVPLTCAIAEYKAFVCLAVGRDAAYVMLRQTMRC